MDTDTDTDTDIQVEYIINQVINHINSSKNTEIEANTNINQNDTNDTNTNDTNDTNDTNKNDTNKNDTNTNDTNTNVTNTNDTNTNDTNDICIYEPIQYNYLWKSSCMFLVTTCYTVYQAKYEFIVFPAGVFLTSINYWRRPVYNSWQRSLDVFYVHFSIFYNMFRSLGAEYMYQFNSFVILGLLFYMLSNYNQRQKRLYISALLHSFVHLLGNVALIYLYSGDILTMGYNPAVRGIRDICENMVD